MSEKLKAYSRYTLQALTLMGQHIALARKSKKITAEALSERCGISRVTLRKIERGEPTTEIGSVFEVAAILGVPLFEEEDVRSLQARSSQAADKLALLPKSIRLRKIVDDDF